MKPVRIVHHIAETEDNPPAFVILMSDGKEYISYKNIFIENTPANVAQLEKNHFIKSQLSELLHAPSLADEDLVDGTSMFAGCSGLTEPGVYPKLKFGRRMYEGCTLLTKAGHYANLVNGFSMYKKCITINKVGESPLLIDGAYMYAFCAALDEKGEYPELLFGDRTMYEGCFEPEQEQETTPDLGM